jgi:hypothetical protein
MIEEIEKLLNKNKIKFSREGDSIVIFERNLAISILKLYKNSNMAGKSNSHNLKLFELFEKRGIRLIQIFESETANPKKVLSRIKSYLGLIPHKIHARKCEIKEINTDLKNKFLNKYHIQGQDYGVSISLGVFFKHRLVSVASFIKRGAGIFELSRFSGNRNFRVCGGASKIMSYFEKTYNPKKIYSFADRRWSAGNVYLELGFKPTKITHPSYWYFKQNSKDLLHKFGFRRKYLPKKLLFFDEKFSEWENMKNNGYDRVWDCGLIKFEKNLNKVP